MFSTYASEKRSLVSSTMHEESSPAEEKAMLPSTSRADLKRRAKKKRRVSMHTQHLTALFSNPMSLSSNGGYHVDD